MKKELTMDRAWAPTDNDRNWLKGLFYLMADRAVWSVPATGQTFVKRGDALVWTNEEIGDHAEIFARSKMIGHEIGIDVIKESEL
jgi:hypothetical protein